MILSSKGKFFNKVNIIDILIILVIIVAIIGAYFRFNGKNVVTENETTTFCYSIVIREIREENKNLLVKSQSEQTSFILDGKISSTMGKLVDIKVSDTEKIVEISDGTLVNTSVPEKYDVTLVLEVDGYESDSGYYTPENFEICAGKKYSIANIYSLVEGVVEEVWVK